MQNIAEQADPKTYKMWQQFSPENLNFINSLKCISYSTPSSQVAPLHLEVFVSVKTLKSVSEPPLSLI